MGGGGGGGSGGGYDTDVIRRIELLEQRVSMGSAMGGGGTAGLQNIGEDVQPRIIKDKMTDQIRIEETLVDYMEIINGLNAKINNHIHSTKVSLRDVEIKAAQGGGPSYLAAGQTSPGSKMSKGGQDSGLDNMKLS